MEAFAATDRTCHHKSHRSSDSASAFLGSGCCPHVKTMTEGKWDLEKERALPGYPVVVMVRLEFGSSLYWRWSFSLLSSSCTFKNGRGKNTPLACINFLSVQRKHRQTKILLCEYLFPVLCVSPFFTEKAGLGLEQDWKTQVCWEPFRRRWWGASRTAYRN